MIDEPKILLKLSLPLEVYINNRKRIVNMNNFRNWHYQVKNKVKRIYQEQIASQIPKKVALERVDLVFFMHQADRRKRDRSNICCLHEKFACDAMVKEGFLVDDNDKFVNSTHYYTGDIDKDNPRVDLYVLKANGVANV